jgi:hypothetical protein
VPYLPAKEGGKPTGSALQVVDLTIDDDSSMDDDDGDGVAK